MYFHQILKIIYYTHETMPYYLLDSIVGEWTGLHKNYQIKTVQQFYQPVPFMVDIRHFHFITAFMLYVLWLDSLFCPTGAGHIFGAENKRNQHWRRTTEETDT